MDAMKKTVARLAVRKCGNGWQVYDLNSAWCSRTLWAYYHLAQRELEIHLVTAVAS